jgi:hypothetical protein
MSQYPNHHSLSLAPNIFEENHTFKILPTQNGTTNTAAALAAVWAAPAAWPVGPSGFRGSAAPPPPVPTPLHAGGGGGGGGADAQNGGAPLAPGGGGGGGGEGGGRWRPGPWVCDDSGCEGVSIADLI